MGIPGQTSTIRGRKIAPRGQGRVIVESDHLIRRGTVSDSAARESQRAIPDEANPGEDIFVPRPPEFMTWARRVMAWMRRHTKPYGYYRISDGVAAALDSGLELVD